MVNNTANYLGFDYGEQRIGIAIGQLITRSATPLETLWATNNKPDWKGIARLVEQWQPQGFVVGVPVHMDGSNTRITDKAKRFAHQLNGRFGISVHYCDERLSSNAAHDLIKSARQKGARNKTRKGDEDKIAAALILQNWLETFDGNS